MKIAGGYTAYCLRLLALASWGWLLVVNGAFAAPRVARYEIAITPFLPVRTTLQNYEPMRQYLEEHLQAPVSLVTAADYHAFNERMRQHAYPFVITVANSAYVAWRDYGYRPLLRPQILTRPVLVVKKGRELKSMQDLRGDTIMLPDEQAIVSMQGVEMLRELGLIPGQDVRLQHVENHAAAVNRLITGEAGAAIVSDRALQQMQPATRDAVRVEMIWDKGAAPGVVYLASPKKPQAEAEALIEEIQNFLKTEQGQALMQRLGYGTMVPATVEDLKPLAPYGEQLKRLIEKNR